MATSSDAEQTPEKSSTEDTTQPETGPKAEHNPSQHVHDEHVPFIHHAPHQMHGMTMPDAPLLAMAFWKGDGLMNKSRLERVA